jgi:hypothetical protein
MSERNYTLTGPCGYRRGSMSRANAVDKARRMQSAMTRNGWPGTMRVFYRDGTEVSTSPTPTPGATP